METFTEYFNKQQFDKSLFWKNEPKNWHIKDKSLTIEPTAKTDYWQRTYYGFRVMNAPSLVKEIQGNFTIETEVTFNSKNRYDQAGLIVYINDDFWIKTSIEHETDEFSHLGAVVTNMGYSDWSVQKISSTVKSAKYRIEKSDNVYIIKASLFENKWEQLRITHLNYNSDLVSAGIYACSPTSEGFSCCFNYINYI